MKVIKNYLDYLPEDIAIIVWKYVYTSNVVNKIKNNKCELCSRFMKKSYKNICFLCLISRIPCVSCLRPCHKHEFILEYEPDFSGSALILLKNEKRWYTQDMLYSFLLSSQYTCLDCNRKHSRCSY